MLLRNVGIRTPIHVASHPERTKFPETSVTTFMFIPCILNNKCFIICQLLTPHRTAPHTHTHTHTPNQELHIRPHLPRCYHNTLLYCILSF